MTNAQDRGWGTGWPNCQTSKWVDVRPLLTQTSFGSCHILIRELVERLIDESVLRGYKFKDGQCWGANCRAIRGTSIPSNHSWGLAMDFNSLENPLGSTSGWDIPSWMPPLWAEYGFAWGGNFASRKDAMHFEFVFTPTDASALTLRARERNIGEDMPLTPEQENLLTYLKGFKKFHDGGAEPKDAGPSREGWNDARKGVELPKQGA